MESAVSTAADWYDKRGEYDKALPLYQELLAERRARLGPDHHAVAAVLCSIGEVYRVRKPCGPAPPYPTRLTGTAAAVRRKETSSRHWSTSRTISAFRELRWARATTRWR